MRNQSLQPGANRTAVLATAIAAMALTGPGQTIGVSVFIDHFVDDLGVTRAQVSTAYLVGTLSASLFLPPVGRAIDRLGVRRSQIIVGLVFAGALLNMSFVSGIVTLTIGFFGIRLLGQGALSLIAAVTVSLRFTRRRGTALGVHSTVSAGLLAVVPVVLALTISATDWRIAWRLAALVVGVVVPGVAYVALRNMPRSSAEASAQAADELGTETDADYDRAEAVRTRAFWVLAAVGAAAGMLSTALNFHQIDLLGSVGLSEEAAAAMFLPQVVGSSVAGVGVGALADRVGTRFLPALGGSLLIAAHLLASVVAPGVVVFAYAVVLGAAGGAINTLISTLLPLYFGTRHLGSIQGTLRVLNAGASALGPVALAVLEAQLGSYPPAILLLATLAAAATLFAATGRAPVSRGPSRSR